MKSRKQFLLYLYIHAYIQVKHNLLYIHMKVKVLDIQFIRVFVTHWTIASQASWSMGFSRQEYWSRWPFPSPGDLPYPGIKPKSPALQADSLQSESPGKCINYTFVCMYVYIYIYIYIKYSLVAQMVKNLPAMQKTQIQSLG